MLRLRVVLMAMDPNTPDHPRYSNRYSSLLTYWGLILFIVKGIRILSWGMNVKTTVELSFTPKEVEGVMRAWREWIATTAISYWGLRPILQHQPLRRW